GDVDAVAERFDVSNEVVLLSAWQAFLWRISGEANSIVEVFSAGREYDELHGAIGLIGRAIPVGARFDEELSFADLLKQVSDSLAEAQKWQEYFAPPESQSLPVAFDYAELLETAIADLRVSVVKQEPGFAPSKLRLSARRQGASVALEIAFDSARL